MSCDKVLVSTPDILAIAKEFREYAEYLPNPVDMQIFYLKPMVDHGEKEGKHSNRNKAVRFPSFGSGGILVEKYIRNYKYIL
ncbi:MAG: hypothetical protein QW146_09200 [Candidatus Bathyarchaeia archaeon]